MILDQQSRLKTKISQCRKNSRGHRIYPVSLKKSIVRYADSEGISKEHLSRELGVSIQTLDSWYKIYSKPKTKLEDFSTIALKQKTENSPNNEILDTRLLPTGLVIAGNPIDIADLLRRLNAPTT